MDLKIIDNFLLKEDFDNLCKIKLINVNEDEIKVYHNKIFRDGKIEISECINEVFLKRLFDNYNKKTLDILGDLCPEKLSLYEYSEFHIIETGSKYKFPIHDDTPNKLLSGVIYLAPEENSGTIFYSSKKGDNKNEIEWKQNRAVFFSRKEKKTWHSYEGNGRENRIALVYNLMTSKIKDVANIEKVGYLSSLLRYKLNPYFYRYFKKTF